jgi:hypothetical protein
MLRSALLLAAFLVAFVAGCDSSDSKKPFTTTSESPPIKQLPEGVKIPDQKGTPKDAQKVDKTKPN